MKVFKYKFSRLTLIFIGIGIALGVLGLVSNVFIVVTGDISSAADPIYPIIQYVLMFIIPIVLLVILISLLVSSYYSVEGDVFKTSFGIIKSKYSIGDITTIVLDRTTNKLSVFFKNNSFIVIVVKEEWYDEFIDELCKANSEIEFSIKSIESDGKDDKNNKKK